MFNGFAEEGTTDYTSNGLNQYTLTSAAPPPPEGQANPDPSTVTSEDLEYDGNGSLSGIRVGGTLTKSFTYDAENRLVEVHDRVDNNVVRFQYDGKGRRIAKLVDDALGGSFVADKTYEYLYEGDEPIQDYLKVSGSYVITHRYLHGASVDERLVHWQYDQNTGAELTERFYHRDHQGSIIAMSDAGGARPAGELYTYDAYGNMVTGTTSGQPFRYTGRRWDDETGLYYYRARYYSAGLGRFLQTDPIGYEDNMNLYGYVGNDPINNTDPSGEEKFTLDVKALGGVIGGLRFTASVSFDTESFELGGTVSAGAGEVTGFAAVAGLTVEPSSGERAKDQLGVSLNIAAEAQAGVGVVGAVEAEVTLVEANTDDGLNGASGDVNPKGRVGVALGASVTGNVEVSAKSSALAVIAERLGFRPEAERHESERKDD